MRAFLFGLLTVSAMSNLQTHTPPKTQGQPLPDSLEAFLLSQMQERRIPGLQLAVVRNGNIVMLGAYGLANIEHSILVTTQTVFTINSIAKAFTGVAIMQLVEEGKLDIAAPVSRYLDGLPATWQAVTLQQLLTHTSGLPSLYDDAERMVADGGEDAVLAKLLTLAIEFAPGERFSYNATNYLLLGRIIDTLSGQPFTRFISERQLQVVDMPLTVFADSHDVVPHSARGYTFFRTVGGELRRTD